MSFFSKKKEPEYPPASWSKPADHLEVAAAAKVALPETPAHEREFEVPAKAAPTTAVSTEAPVQASLIEDAPDGATASSTLAMRIRDLIPSKFLDNNTQPVPPPPTTPNAPPPRPAPPAWLDTQVARLLESAEVMNGAITQGQKSVWDTLERIRAPSSAKAGPSSTEKGKSKAETPGEDSESDDDDDSSVMLYAPLVPNNDSKLELAEREIVRMDAEGRIVSVVRDEPAHVMPEADGKPAESEGSRLERTSSWWPFKKQAPPSSPSQPATPAHETPGTTATAAKTTEAPPKETLAEGLKRHISTKLPLAAADDMVEGLKRKVTQKVSQKMHERAVWVPSPTQISFQANWWGYRIYLPPPVLLVLDDKSVEASKKVAMLTTALQWLFNKLPMAVVPLQFRPGVLVAKRFLPYVGYIGAAIVYGWSSISGYNKGNGIVMSATWILPLAILPNTWDTAKYPKAQAPSEGVSIPITTV